MKVSRVQGFQQLGFVFWWSPSSIMEVYFERYRDNAWDGGGGAAQEKKPPHNEAGILAEEFWE